eukprot:scaffold138008_cov31-Tisochrysis_lutea.AAC.6
MHVASNCKIRVPVSMALSALQVAPNSAATHVLAPRAAVTTARSMSQRRARGAMSGAPDTSCVAGAARRRRSPLRRLPASRLGNAAARKPH